MNITNFHNALKNKISKLIFLKNSAHDHILITEFPKSGLSFFCMLLITYHHKLKGNLEVEGTLFNQNLFIPDVDVGYRNQGTKLFNKFKFLRSHTRGLDFIKRAICIVRNPFDVMCSYYRYSVEKERNFIGSFEDFLNYKKIGLEAWKKYHYSWLEKNTLNEFILLKYEDLKKGKDFEEFLKITGIEINNRLIDESLNIHSITNAKKTNELYIKKNPLNNFLFTGGTKNFQTERTIEKINTETYDLRAELYGKDIAARQYEDAKKTLV